MGSFLGGREAAVAADTSDGAAAGTYGSFV